MNKGTRQEKGQKGATGRPSKVSRTKVFKGSSKEGLKESGGPGAFAARDKAEPGLQAFGPRASGLSFFKRLFSNSDLGFGVQGFGFIESWGCVGILADVSDLYGEFLDLIRTFGFKIKYMQAENPEP